LDAFYLGPTVLVNIVGYVVQLGHYFFGFFGGATRVGSPLVDVLA
jgi:hypothetical protein